MRMTAEGDVTSARALFQHIDDPYFRMLALHHVGSCTGLHAVKSKTPWDSRW